MLVAGAASGAQLYSTTPASHGLPGPVSSSRPVSESESPPNWAPQQPLDLLAIGRFSGSLGWPHYHDDCCLLPLARCPWPGRAAREARRGRGRNSIEGAVLCRRPGFRTESVARGRTSHSLRLAPVGNPTVRVPAGFHRAVRTRACGTAALSGSGSVLKSRLHCGVVAAAFHSVKCRVGASGSAFCPRGIEGRHSAQPHWRQSSSRGDDPRRAPQWGSRRVPGGLGLGFHWQLPTQSQLSLVSL